MTCYPKNLGYYVQVSPPPFCITFERPFPSKNEVSVHHRKAVKLAAVYNGIATCITASCKTCHNKFLTIYSLKYYVKAKVGFIYYLSCSWETYRRSLLFSKLLFAESLKAHRKH
jgi:hypothetical protein